MNLTELTVEALQALATEKRTAFDAIVALDAPTAAQVTEAEGLAADLDAIAAEQEAREAAAAKSAETLAALRNKFHDDQAEAEQVEVEDEVTEEDEDEVVEAEVIDEPVEVNARGQVATLARRTTRPAKPPALQVKPIAITAAADVPDYATGQALDMDEVGKALVNRMRAFGTPSGDGLTENLQHYGVAKFSMDFPDELTIDRHSDDMEVLSRAGRETRLPGNSLVASGGWCAPSEQLYDLCTTETTEGILSVPEVKIARGGIKYTSGPDFASIYSAVGFLQTEAQAISGTTKTCYEVPCPSFVEARLDAVGICIKAPILTNAAYPELVRRWLDGSMIAHQHKVNATVIARMVTAAGAARVYTGVGTTAGDTLDALELVAESLREKYAMGLSTSMEVVVPSWVKGAIRSDLSKRMGLDSTEVVTDAIIQAHFAARNLQVTFVYDWNPLPTLDTVIVYPATFQALMYPAGTFIKGTSDVINLNAVYDAASLAGNIYTALFFEQGLLVAKMCNQAALVTLPVCNAGRVGAANFTCP